MLFGIIKQMTSQNGQHGKPAAQILHCPSEFCKFQLFMSMGCPWGGGGGGGGGGCSV